MEDAERRKLLGLLDEGAEALHAAVAGMGEGDAARRPGEGRWSVVEAVEHLAASEAALLERLREARATGESREDRAREEKFAGLALNRGRVIEAPEAVRPRGEAGSLAEAVRRFEAVRAETLRFVEEYDGDLRWSEAVHPLIARPVNCYEMLLLMALHPKRHAEQIGEIRVELAGKNG